MPLAMLNSSFMTGMLTSLAGAPTRYSAATLHAPPGARTIYPIRPVGSVNPLCRTTEIAAYSRAGPVSSQGLLFSTELARFMCELTDPTGYLCQMASAPSRLNSIKGVKFRKRRLCEPFLVESAGIPGTSVYQEVGKGRFISLKNLSTTGLCASAIFFLDYRNLKSFVVVMIITPNYFCPRIKTVVVRLNM